MPNFKIILAGLISHLEHSGGVWGGIRGEAQKLRAELQATMSTYKMNAAVEWAYRREKMATGGFGTWNLERGHPVVVSLQETILGCGETAPQAAIRAAARSGSMDTFYKVIEKYGARAPQVAIETAMNMGCLGLALRLLADNQTQLPKLAVSTLCTMSMSAQFVSTPGVAPRFLEMLEKVQRLDERQGIALVQHLIESGGVIPAPRLLQTLDLYGAAEPRATVELIEDCTRRRDCATPLTSWTRDLSYPIGEFQHPLREEFNPIQHCDKIANFDTLESITTALRLLETHGAAAPERAAMARRTLLKHVALMNDAVATAYETGVEPATVALREAVRGGDLRQRNYLPPPCQKALEAIMICGRENPGMAMQALADLRRRSHIFESREERLLVYEILRTCGAAAPARAIEVPTDLLLIGRELLKERFIHMELASKIVADCEAVVLEGKAPDFFGLGRNARALIYRLLCLSKIDVPIQIIDDPASLYIHAFKIGQIGHVLDALKERPTEQQMERVRGIESEVLLVVREMLQIHGPAVPEIAECEQSLLAQLGYFNRTRSHSSRIAGSTTLQ